MPIDADIPNKRVGVGYRHSFHPQNSPLKFYGKRYLTLPHGRRSLTHRTHLRYGKRFKTDFQPLFRYSNGLIPT